MEPKFKVGDLVKHINGPTTWYIKEVRKKDYLLEPGPTNDKFSTPGESLYFYDFDPQFELDQPYLNEQKLKKVLGL